MHLSVIAKILGLLLMVFSTTMLPPVLVAYIYQDGGQIPFLTACAIIFVSGLVLWLPFMRANAELQTRDGFLVVTLFWTVLGVMGSVPLMLVLDLSVTDAVFESISGLTTTGATVLSGLDDMPKSLLFYRQQLQWLGGMGVIVLAIAILPMLGVGGMQLYKAEIPGPMKESKLTPRVAETAKLLWYVYLTISILCALSYWWAGMTPFDAIALTFSTVSTGGFAPYDDSIAFFDSRAVELVGVIFMFLGGCSFALMFTAWKLRSPLIFWRDPEFRVFLGLTLAYIIIVDLILWFSGVYQARHENLIHSAFQVVSFSTGTGLTSGSAATWPSLVPFLLVFTSFISGCAGSTTAGMKVVRASLVFQHGMRELRRLIYPHGIFALRFGRRAVDDQVLQAVWGFVGVYITLAVLMTLLLTATGLDLATATSALAASLNNLGVGIEGVADGFSHLSPAAKWIMCGAMLLGRLEVFTILVLFTPMFWRQ
ncbi:MAG: potassium transporter TrkG [Alcanivoracaceae bacterium]|jgi:trk system potassium uptake protein TrkH|nr:potassium transporter TrkG [Alcanivoracaceae bacterium]